MKKHLFTILKIIKWIVIVFVALIILFHSTYYKTDASYIDDMKEQGIVMDKIVDCGIEYVDLEIYLLHK